MPAWKNMMYFASLKQLMFVQRLLRLPMVGTSFCYQNALKAAPYRWITEGIQKLTLNGICSCFMLKQHKNVHNSFTLLQISSSRPFFAFFNAWHRRSFTFNKVDVARRRENKDFWLKKNKDTICALVFLHWNIFFTERNEWNKNYINKTLQNILDCLKAAIRSRHMETIHQFQTLHTKCQGYFPLLIMKLQIWT